MFLTAVLSEAFIFPCLHFKQGKKLQELSPLLEVKRNSKYIAQPSDTESYSQPEVTKKEAEEG